MDVELVIIYFYIAGCSFGQATHGAHDPIPQAREELAGHHRRVSCHDESKRDLDDGQRPISALLRHGDVVGGEVFGVFAPGPAEEEAAVGNGLADERQAPLAIHEVPLLRGRVERHRAGDRTSRRRREQDVAAGHGVGLDPRGSRRVLEPGQLLLAGECGEQRRRRQGALGVRA